MEPRAGGRLSARRLETESHVRLIIAGELDFSEHEVALDAIRAAEAEEPRLLVIDLTEVEFIDSTGVKTLLDLEGRARVHQRAVRLIVGPVVGRVLDIAGIAAYFDLVRRP
jgi:anti-sigma B factor antagonist/stage II sporulation protein AA (anti-sigma F factor antagonist)